MAENKKYNSILVSGRKDETLTYSRYIKDEETGKSVKESLDGKISTTDKIDINQIAQAVWDKLKDEYLRLDGGNVMHGDLKMNHKMILCLSEIRGARDIGAAISLGVNDTIVKTISFGNDGNPVEYVIAKLAIEGVTFPESTVESKGYKTTDRSKIGLLVNDGSVGLAMSDSDIDGLFQRVFQTVIG